MPISVCVYMCVWVMGLDVGKPREEYTTCLLWHTQSLNTSGRREQHSMGSIPKFQNNNNINSQQNYVGRCFSRSSRVSQLRTIAERLRTALWQYTTY